MPELTPVDHDPFAPYQLAPVDHDPWAEAQTHQAERPNPAAPIVQEATQLGRDFWQGGIQRVLEGRGISTPEASQSVGRFLTSEPVNAALGAITPSPAGKLAPLVASERGAITAYHGSPHDFDRFDLSKIGTGEGAQAYGHGLYFAENEGVAKSYKDALDPKKRYLAQVVSKEMQAGTPHDQIALKLSSDPLLRSRSPQEINNAIEYVKNNPELKPGKMYQVAIKADPEHFLDWDKPLSEQHGKVQEAIGNNFLLPTKPTDTGQQIYDSFMSYGRGSATHEEASANITKRLREAGIPGIKYLDQGSRAQPVPTYPQGYKITPPAQNIHGKWMVKSSDYNSKGMLFDTQEKAQAKLDEMFPGFELPKPKETRNYVVFDDKLIDILKKYGIAGIGALPAMGAYHFQTSAVDHDPFAE